MQEDSGEKGEKEPASAKNARAPSPSIKHPNGGDLQGKKRSRADRRKRNWGESGGQGATHLQSQNTTYPKGASHNTKKGRGSFQDRTKDPIIFRKWRTDSTQRERRFDYPGSKGI